MKILRIFQVFLKVFLYLCIVFILLFNIVPKFGYLFVSIDSGSMEPVLRVGSLCIVNTKIDREHIPSKSIITFRIHTGDSYETGDGNVTEVEDDFKDVYVTHRMLSYKDEFEGLDEEGNYISEPMSVVTKGDNNNVKDFRTTPIDDILGVVVLNFPPPFGYLLKSFDYTVMRVGIICMLFCMILIIYFLDVVLEHKEGLYSKFKRRKAE